MDAALPAPMDAYLPAIATKAVGTRDAYRRILRDLSTWLAAKPGGTAGFVPNQLTQTAVSLIYSGPSGSRLTFRRYTPSRASLGSATITRAGRSSWPS